MTNRTTHLSWILPGGSALLLCAAVGCGGTAASDGSGAAATSPSALSSSGAAAGGNSSTSTDSDGDFDGFGGPPQAAVDACATLASGAACTFVDPNHGSSTLSGTCDPGPGAASSTLACRPAFAFGHGGGDHGRGGPGGPHGGPPQAAIDACAGLASGGACSFADPRSASSTLSGTCEPGPGSASSTLACRPTPPAPPQAALDACSGLASGATCTMADPRNASSTASGVCGLPPGLTIEACLLPFGPGGEGHGPGGPGPGGPGGRGGPGGPGGPGGGRHGR